MKGAVCKNICARVLRGRFGGIFHRFWFLVFCFQSPFEKASNSHFFRLWRPLTSSHLTPSPFASTRLASYHGANVPSTSTHLTSAQLHLLIFIYSSYIFSSHILLLCISSHLLIPCISSLYVDLTRVHLNILDPLRSRAICCLAVCTDAKLAWANYDAL